MNASVNPRHDAVHHPAVTALLSRGEPSTGALRRFVAAQDFPLTEPGFVTFAWLGDADSVVLMRWIAGGNDRGPFEQVPNTHLWLLRLPVEDFGRFEYKLAVTRHGHEEWLLDPLNPARAGDPFGENSVCRTFGYERPEWSRPGDAPAGRIETLAVDSDVFGETRHEQLYLPAGHDGTVPCPLVVIHDGIDFVNYADLATSLDNLVARGDVPPFVGALIQTGDRTGEYPGGRRHARYVVNELLPTVAARVAIDDDPGRRVLLGASLGAVASLGTAFRYPGEFRGLVLKSGSFIFDRRKLEGRAHPVFHRIARLVDAFKRAPDLVDTRAFVSTGELEGLADENRTLASLLASKGVDVRFKSAWDGHHWHNWRDQLRDGLVWVLGPGESPRGE